MIYNNAQEYAEEIGKYNFPGFDKIKFSKIKYRTANDKLIPYIEMGFGKVEKSFI